MKTNALTKLIWLAVCAAVMFSAENAVRVDEPAKHSVATQRGAQHASARSAQE